MKFKKTTKNYVAFHIFLLSILTLFCVFLSIRPTTSVRADLSLTGGLILRLDADDSSTLLLSGTNLTGWVDKSASGNNFVQTSFSSTPYLASGWINGKNAIRFDGVNDHLNSISGITADSSTMFFVLRSRLGDSSYFNKRIFNSNSDTHFSFMIYGPPEHTLIGRQSIGTFIPTSIPNCSNAFTIQMDTSGGVTTSSGWSNGIIQHSGFSFGSPGQSPILGGYTHNLGGLYAGSIGNYYSGDIQEVLIYNQVLSNSDRQTVESYLTGKRGIVNCNVDGSIYAISAPTTGRIDRKTTYNITYNFSGAITVTGSYILFDIGTGQTGYDTNTGRSYIGNNTFKFTIQTGLSNGASGSVAFNGRINNGVTTGTALVFTATFIANAEDSYTGNNTKTGSIIADSFVRNNDNYTTQTGFWDQSPDNSDIIDAYFGSGSDKDTAYTHYRTGATHSCTLTGFSVQYLNPGTGDISSTTLTGKTIYVFSSGDYIMNYHKDINYDCVGVVGQGNVRIYSSIQVGTGTPYLGMFYGEFSDNIIYDNITLDGTNNGTGGTHTANANGIYSQKNNFSANRLTLLNFGVRGIWMYSDGVVNSSTFRSNGYGINGYYGYHQIYNSFFESNGNGYNGVYPNNPTISGNIFSGHVSGAGIQASMRNSYIYNNDFFGAAGGYGIALQANTLYNNNPNQNIIKNNRIYKNSVGIHLTSYPGYPSDTVEITDNQVYNNTYDGIVQSNTVFRVRYHNNQIFNNDRGIWIYSTGLSDIDNNQIYNNNIGVDVNAGTGTIISNSQIYNNLQGVNIFNGASSTLFHNTDIYNNGTGLYIESGSLYNKYLQDVFIRGNSINITGSNGSDSAFASGTVPAFGWNSPSLTTGSFTMNCSYATKPYATYYTDITNCANRGKTTLPSSINSLPRDQYYYGINIKYQIDPVFYTGFTTTTPTSEIYTGSPILTSGYYSYLSNQFIASLTGRLSGVADLNISTSYVTGIVTSGQYVLFSVSYMNNSLDTSATGVSLSYTLDPYIIFSSASTGYSGPSSNTVTFSLGTLTAGQTGIIYITGLVTNISPNTQTYLNTGTITTSSYEPSTGDNTATVTGTIYKPVDLQLTAFSIPTTGYVPKKVTYSLSYYYTGYTVATNPYIMLYLGTGQTGDTSNTGWTFVQTGVFKYTFSTGFVSGDSGSISFTGRLLNTLTGGLTLYLTGTIFSDAPEANYSNNTRTGSLITRMFSRNNDYYTTQTGFRDQQPDDTDIIDAYFGSGSDKDTKYTHFRTGATHSCTLTGFSVQYLNPGSGDLSSLTATGNTIYVLYSGSHIITGDRSIEYHNKSCIAFIGQGNAKVYTELQNGAGSTYSGVFFGYTTNYFIFDNFAIDGTGNGAGGTHAQSLQAIYTESSRCTIARLSGYNFYRGMRSYNDTVIINSTFFNNAVEGIRNFFGRNQLYDNFLFNNAYGYGAYAGDYSIVSGNNFSGNTYGISLGQRDILIFNNDIHHNLANGILSQVRSPYLSSRAQVVKNNRIYKNGTAGVSINAYPNDPAAGFELIDNQIYDNFYGVYNGGNPGTNQLFKIRYINNHIYNNNYGVFVDSIFGLDSFNNNQIYNNGTGVYLFAGSGYLFNNNEIYNNSYGVHIKSTIGKSYFNNNNVRNNFFGLSFDTGSSGHLYYGTSYFQSNTFNFTGTNGNDSVFTSGTDAINNWNNGTISSSTLTFNCSYATKPFATYFTFASNCDSKGRITNTLLNNSLPRDNYYYGINIKKQVDPIFYTGYSYNYNELFSSGYYSYNTGFYVAGSTGYLSGVADLNITNTFVSGIPTSGQYMQFAIHYMNNSTDTSATGVSLSYKLDPYLSIVSANTGYSGPISNTITFNLGTLAAEQTGTIYLTALVLLIPTNTGTFLNTGTITTSSFEPSTGDNTSVVTGTLFRPVDLSLVSITHAATGYVGRPRTYSINYLYSGYYTATGVSVLFNIGTGQTGFGVNSGWSYISTGLYLYNFGTGLTNQSSGTLIFTGVISANLTGGVTLYISGTISSSNIYESNYSNNTKTGSLVTRYFFWDNDYYTTQTGFWDQEPNDYDIIDAYFGSGTDKDTKYTHFRTGATHSCIISGFSVQYLNPGSNDLSSLTATGNTIYVLYSGSHIITGDKSIEYSNKNCIAFVGQGNAKVYTELQNGGGSTYSGVFYGIIASYLIFDNLAIDGTGNGAGGSHAQSLQAIYNEGARCTIARISGFNFYRGTRTYNDTVIMNSTFFNNATHGILNYFAKDQIYENFIYNNYYGYGSYNGDYSIVSGNNFSGNVYGFNVAQRDILVFNNEIHHNSSNGYFSQVRAPYLTSRAQVIKNNRIYSNGLAGIYIQAYPNDPAAGIELIDNQIYDNYYGVYEGGAPGVNQLFKVRHINNHIYNNNYGFFIDSIFGLDSLNNNQIYNNGTGVYIIGGSGYIFNNNEIYNNNFGFYISGSVGKSYFNSNNIRNNIIGFWFGTGSSGHLYYGTSYIQSNTLNFTGTNGNDSVFTSGTNALNNWNNGTITTSSLVFNCSYATKPFSTYFPFATNCDSRGRITSTLLSTSLPRDNYYYGINIKKQVDPIFYTGYSYNYAETFYSGYYFYNTGFYVAGFTGYLSGVADLNTSLVPLITGNTSGDIVMYALHFMNNSTDTAALSTVLSFTFDAGIEFVDATPGYFGPTSNTITYSIGTLAAGGSNTAYITGRILYSNALTGLLVSTGTITTSSSEVSTGDNTSFVTGIVYKPLTGTITYYPSSGTWTSGNVVVQLSLNQTGVLIRSGDTYTGQTLVLTSYTENSGFSLFVTSAITSLTRTFTGTIYWIDRIGPVVTGYLDTTGLAIQKTLTLSGYNTGDSFTINYTGDDEFVITSFSGSISIPQTNYDIIANSGNYELTKNLIFTDNWSGYIYLKDRAGNTGSLRVDVYNIDFTPPSILQYSYNPSSGTRTSGNVILTLTGSEPIKIISFTGNTPAPTSFTLPDGGFTTGKSITFTGNWTGYIVFQDEAGNTGSSAFTARVFWIDRVATPVSTSLTLQTGGGYNISKTLTITGVATGYQGFATNTTGDDEFVVFTFSGTAPTTFLTGSDTFGMTKTIVFIDNRSGNVLLKDRAGNVTTTPIQITGLDSVFAYYIIAVPGFRPGALLGTTGFANRYTSTGIQYDTGVGFPTTITLSNTGVAIIYPPVTSPGTLFGFSYQASGFLTVGVTGVYSYQTSGVDFSSTVGLSFQNTYGSNSYMMPGDIDGNNALNSFDLVVINQNLTLSTGTSLHILDFNLDNFTNTYEQAGFLFNAGTNGFSIY